MFGAIKKIFEKKIRHPENRIQELLMLMGAMYIEETNGAIANLKEMYIEEFEEKDDTKSWRKESYEALKCDIIDEFCTIDMNLSGGYKNAARELLEEWWSITDKESAKKCLEWLKNRGHRAYFDTLCESIDKLESMNFSDILDFVKKCRENEIELPLVEDKEINEEKLKESEFFEILSGEKEYVEAVMEELPEFGILAWDCARYVHVVRLCYVAGYFSDKESWEEINKIAGICLKNFDTWEKFADSYLIGRTFWNGDSEEDTITDICSILNEDSVSPWTNFQWPKQN